MGFSIDVTCRSMGLGAFNSEDEEYRVLLPFSRDGSSVATRRFTSSIRINVATICSGWPR